MKTSRGALLARLIILALIGMVAFAVLEHWAARSAPDSFGTIISAVDSLLRDGRETEAMELLRGRGFDRLSSYQYQIILKRVFSLSEGELRDSLLLRYSRAASEEYPGVEPFWALYCDALLRNGRAERAYAIALEKLVSERFISIRAAAALKAGKATDPLIIEAAAESSYRHAGLIKLLDPEAEPELYRAAAEEWRIPELFADAALLYAREGDLEAANTLLRQKAFLHFSELSLQVAYDARDAAHGLAAVDEIRAREGNYSPLIELYRADLLMIEGAEVEALRIYRDLISRAPDYSIIPYLNASALEPQKAFEYLKEGNKRFPDAPRLLERLGELSFREGDMSSAREYFDRLLDIEPENVAARIRRSDAERGSGSLGGDARLWDAYLQESGQESDGDALGLILAWRLFGRRDTEGLALLARQQESRMGPDSAVIMALSRSMDGHYDEAAADFEEAYTRSGHWEYLYNAALLRQYAGDHEAAVDLYQRIENRGLAGNEYDDQARSEVWLGLAESQFALGDLKNARTSLDFALDIDPGNLRAALLRSSMQE
jgi:tetratricopeptide (TPR) repeat protein